MKPLAHAFANEPKAIGARKKYREDVHEEDLLQPVRNIHSDHRVFRGNTYANLKDQFEVCEQGRPAKPAAKRRKEASLFDLPLPKPLREPVDLAAHLEEQNVHVPEVCEMDAQTGAFAPLEPDPPYVPQKRGVDTATMVEDGDLLVGFDQLVTPLVDTLVYKTLDQALLEVNEEEQLAAFTEYRSNWVSRRSEERADWQKHAAQEVARHEETRAIMEKLRIQKAAEEEIRKKMEASALSRAYLQNLVPGSLDQLAERNFFSDPDRDAATQFFTYVAGLAASRTENPLPRLVDSLVTRVVTDQRDRRRAAREALLARQEQARIEAEKKRIAELTKSVTIRVTDEPEEGEEGPVERELTLGFRLDEDFTDIKNRMLALLQSEVKGDYSLGIDFVCEDTVLEDPKALAKAESVSIKQVEPVNTEE